MINVRQFLFGDDKPNDPFREVSDAHKEFEKEYYGLIERSSAILINEGWMLDPDKADYAIQYTANNIAKRTARRGFEQAPDDVAKTLREVISETSQKRLDEAAAYARSLANNPDVDFYSRDEDQRAQVIQTTADWYANKWGIKHPAVKEVLAEELGRVFKVSREGHFDVLMDEDNPASALLKGLVRPATSTARGFAHLWAAATQEGTVKQGAFYRALTDFDMYFAPNIQRGDITNELATQLGSTVGMLAPMMASGVFSPFVIGGLVTGGVGENIRRTTEAGLSGAAQGKNVIGNAAIDVLMFLPVARLSKVFLSTPPTQKLASWAMREALINAGAFTGGTAGKLAVDKLTGLYPDITIGEVLAEAGTAGLITIPASLVARYSVSGFRNFYDRIPVISEETVNTGRRGDRSDGKGKPQETAKALKEPSGIGDQAVKQALTDVLAKSQEHSEVLSNFDAIALKTAFEMVEGRSKGEARRGADIKLQRKLFARETLTETELAKVSDIITRFSDIAATRYKVDASDFANKVRELLPKQNEAIAVRREAILKDIKDHNTRIAQIKRRLVTLSKNQKALKAGEAKSEIAKWRNEIAERQQIVGELATEIGIKRGELETVLKGIEEMRVRASEQAETALKTPDAIDDMGLPEQGLKSEIKGSERIGASERVGSSERVGVDEITSDLEADITRGRQAQKDIQDTYKLVAQASLQGKLTKPAIEQFMKDYRIGFDELGSGAQREIVHADGSKTLLQWQGLLNIPKADIGKAFTDIPALQKGDTVKHVVPTITEIIAQEASGKAVSTGVKQRAAIAHLDKAVDNIAQTKIGKSFKEYAKLRAGEGGDITDIAAWGDAAMQARVSRETLKKLSSNKEFKELVAQERQLRKEIEDAQQQTKIAQTRIDSLGKRIRASELALKRMLEDTKEQALTAELVEAQNQREVLKAQIATDKKAIEKYTSLLEVGDSAVMMEMQQRIEAVNKEIYRLYEEARQDFDPFEVVTNKESVRARAKELEDKGLIQDNVRGFTKLMETQIAPLLPDSVVSWFKKQTSYMTTIAARNPYARMILDAYHNTNHVFSRNIKDMLGDNVGLQKYYALRRVEQVRINDYLDFTTNARLDVRTPEGVEALRRAGANDMVIDIIKGFDAATRKSVEKLQVALSKEFDALEAPSQEVINRFYENFSYLQGLKEAPFYVPFTRQGSFPVVGKKPPNKVPMGIDDIVSPFAAEKEFVRYHAKTGREAAKVAERLRKAGYIEVETLPQIEFKIEGLSALPAHIQALISSEALETIRLRGYKGRFADKDFISGYDKDFGGAFQNFYAQTAYSEGKRGLSNALPHIIAEMEASQKAGKTKLSDLQIAREWAEFLVKDHQKNNAIKAALFNYYLYGNFKSAFGVNITQTPVLGVPLLAREVGYTKAWRFYQRAWREELLLRVNKGKVPPELQEAVRNFGDIAARETFASQIEGQNLRAKAIRAGDFFSHVETFNVRSSFIARWLALHKEAGSPRNITPEMAKEWFLRSQQHAREVNFVNTYANYPKFQRPASTLFMFRNFIGQFFATLTHADAKTSALLLTHLSLLGGAISLPLVRQIVDIMENMFGIDVKRHVRKAVGNEMASALIYGLPAKAFGINISGSMSLGEIIPEIDQYTSAWEIAGNLVLGVVADPFVRAGRAADFFAKEQPGRAFETLLPEALRSVAVAGRYAKEGVRRSFGEMVMSPEEVTTGMIGRRAVGFSPTETVEAYDKRFSLQMLKKQREEGAERINAKLAVILFEDGEQAMRKAWVKFLVEQAKKPSHLRVKPDPKAIQRKFAEMHRGTFPIVRNLPVALRGEAREALEGR